MTVSADIVIGLTNLSVSYDAAAPLKQASHAVIKGLIDQAESLVVVIESNIASTGKSLDIDSLSGNAIQMAAQLNQMMIDSADHQTLADMRGFVGRVVSNLHQVGF